MPFLKALMPCATSPIRSEILPRPNNSRTTAITTIQCQMLSEPILHPSKHTGRKAGLIFPESRLRGGEKQGLRPRQIAVSATQLIGVAEPFWAMAIDAKSAFALGFRLYRPRQREFQIVDIQRILVIGQR